MLEQFLLGVLVAFVVVGVIYGALVLFGILPLP